MPKIVEFYVTKYIAIKNLDTHTIIHKSKVKTIANKVTPPVGDNEWSIFL